jgi:hypothetical protein
MPRKNLPVLYTTLTYVILALVSCQDESTSLTPAATQPEFADLVVRLSEPGGYFDTDNLISNEASYLHVSDALDSLGLVGGAYLGVGPDQNFSYIARTKPSYAFLVDIRRDNMLQHLFFKALFTLSEDRLAFLCRLFGKSEPPASESERPSGIREIVAYVDSAPRSENSVMDEVLDRVDTFGLQLAARDRETIARIHHIFVDRGMDLQFNSHNRNPLPDYPTYRDLTLESSHSGAFASYLADETAYQFLKSMHVTNRIIPVVGDLAGPKALRSIARFLNERQLKVSAFYTSNVEFYLMSQGQFANFIENVYGLPTHEKSVIIRSYFNRWATHPESVPGYSSTQLLQPIDDMTRGFETGVIKTYLDLVYAGYDR